MAPGQLLLSGEFDLLFSASPPLESIKCDRLCKNRPCSHLVVIRETFV